MRYSITNFQGVITVSIHITISRAKYTYLLCSVAILPSFAALVATASSRSAAMEDKKSGQCQ
ncbi:MAG: hypothetical protein QXN37_00310 [Candidatus Anstonellaceae archaeon]